MEYLQKGLRASRRNFKKDGQKNELAEGRRRRNRTNRGVLYGSPGGGVRFTLQITGSPRGENFAFQGWGKNVGGKRTLVVATEGRGQGGQGRQSPVLQRGGGSSFTLRRGKRIGAQIEAILCPKKLTLMERQRS